MRRQDNLNVFTEEFLNQIEQRHHEGRTQYEASLAGPWQVVKLGDRRYAVKRAGERSDEEPAAIFESRETALLLAAVLPLIGRTNPYHLSAALQGDLPIEIQAITGGRRRTVGLLRYRSSSTVQALHLAESLLRSPTAFSLLLEAAGYEVLHQAGRLAFLRGFENHEG